jgi:LmbE family N-acetylglucosaminyl deacetylase
MYQAPEDSLVLRAMARSPWVLLSLAIWICMLMPNDALASGPPPQPNSAQIEKAIDKLAVVGSVLYVAAHPDDENTNLLAYLANERLLRTGYLSLTRGDGGQNLIGSEQGTDLGVIRTQELLAARRIDGAEQFFSRARDFGYSKNPQETLRIWGKDPVLADVVLAVRRFRPDVIITRFSPEPSETHGHHTASAELALAAFHAAADPAFHPEQLSETVQPWQARRIYWNRSFWSIKPGDDLSGFHQLDVNVYDPVLGVSVGEMAAESRSMHKSQGFGVARSRGPMVEYFRLLDRASPTDTGEGLLDGIDVSWKRVPGGAAVARLIAKARREFVPSAPHKTIPTLVAIDKALAGVRDVHWRDKKRAETQALMVACAGLFAEATAADYRVVPGHPVAIRASALNRSPARVALSSVRFVGGAAAHPSVSDEVAVGKRLGEAEVEVNRQLHTPPDLPLSGPYWLARRPEPGLFRPDPLDEVIQPDSPPGLAVDFTFEFDGHAVHVARPVVFKWTDPVAGERYRPVEVVPLISVRPSTRVLVMPSATPRTLSVRLTAAAPASGALRVEVPAGWTVTPSARTFTLPQKDAELDFDFRVQPPNQTEASAIGTVRFVARIGEQDFSQEVVHIEHDHIPVQVVLGSSEVKVVAVPIVRAGQKIGYLQGSGDQVPVGLRDIGYDVTELDAAGLSPKVLGGFDAVLVGVRAFNTKDKLRSAHAMLMDYVQSGGTLVVQYNTNSRLGPLSIPLGPFPFTIGSERVTDENAQVTVTPAGQRLVAWPNRLSAQDFQGWVQERGLYFASTWDGRYETPFAMNDPGEKSLQGSVLVARHGKGVFVYTGLSFFRQLPAGVPGAFRLLANLIAVGQARHEP